MTQQNLYPTLRCWARLVNALTRSFKTFRIGLKVFEAMRRSPIVPDAVCYQIVIYNCHIFREQKYALKYYREMTKKGILPSVETYKALIEMFIKLKKFTKAQQIVEALISQFGNQENLPSEVWNTILQMYCLARDIFNAEKTYSQMVANNKSLESRSYHAMLDMYIETGHPEKAIQLYSSLGSFHKDSNNIAVLNGLLLKAYTLANRIIDAWKLFEELKNSHSLTTVHCNSMLSILAKQGKVDECMKIIDQMKLNSIPFSSFTYTSLITLCAFTGQPQKGLDYFMEALNTRMINESAIFQALQLCTTYKMGPVASRIISHPKVLLYRVNLVHIIKAIEANFVSGQVVMALELVFLLKKIRLYLNENFVHQLCSFLDSVSLPSQLTLEKERWKEWKFQHKDWNGHNKEREEFLSFIDRCIQALRSSAADTKKQ
jgi:pentatricopeptide repeat protein